MKTISLSENSALYFLAIVPPSPVYEYAKSLKESFRENYNSKASLNSPPHITLHMPFQWKEKKEQQLIDSLAFFSAKQNSFEMSLRNYGCFEPRVIFIDVEPNEQLSQIQQQLHRHMKKSLNVFNAQYKDQPFHPHLTIAFRDLKKQSFYKAWEEFKNKNYSANCTVDSITLLKHNGKIWEIFNKFDLAANN
jgi:2'-5' RNA ligase